MPFAQFIHGSLVERYAVLPQPVALPQSLRRRNQTRTESVEANEDVTIEETQTLGEGRGNFQNIPATRRRAEKHWEDTKLKQNQP